MSGLFKISRTKLAAVTTRLGIRSAPDIFLAEALSELDEKRTDKPAWAKALSKASGNHDKARALYIRIRGQYLADAAKERQCVAEREALCDNLQKRIGNLSDQIDTYEQAIQKIRARLTDGGYAVTHPYFLKLQNELKERLQFLDRLREMRAVAEAEMSLYKSVN